MTYASWNFFKTSYVKKTADYYEIFPDKTIYSARINGPQLIDSQFIDPLLIESQLIWLRDCPKPFLPPQIIDSQFIDPH